MDPKEQLRRFREVIEQRESQEMMSIIMDNAPISITLMNYNGYFTFFNKQAETNLRFTADLLKSKNIIELFPEEGPKTLVSIRKIFHDKKPELCEVVYNIEGIDKYFEMNRIPLFDNKGEVFSVMSIGRDITENKRQEQLLNLQHKIDSVSNISSDLKSTLKSVFLYLQQIEWVDCGGIYLLNEEKESFELEFSSGLSEKFIKRMSHIHISTPQAQSLLKKIPRFADKSGFIKNTQNFLLHEGFGSIVVIPLVYLDEVIGSLNLASRRFDSIDEFTFKILESIALRLANLIILVKTRSELDQSNDELNNRLQELSIKQQMLIQKSRLESLGELSAGLAHEINQPLSIISLAMENAHYKLEQKATTEEYLTNKFATISQNINKIRELIEHVRTFSRDQGTILFDKVNVNQVINDALSMINSQLRYHYVKVFTDLSPGLGYTIGNPSRFEQVMLNLISNARDAVEEKERSTKSNSISKEIHIATESRDDRIIITVRDNGTGIPEANLQKIFNPFFTTKTAVHGTGLGLPIVYGIIREMKGEITARSSEGEYTEIIIHLPEFKNIMEK